MLIKLRPEGHWTKRPEGLRMFAEHKKKGELRTEEMLKEIKRRFGLKWKEAEG